MFRRHGGDPTNLEQRGSARALSRKLNWSEVWYEIMRRSFKNLAEKCEHDAAGTGKPL